MKIIPAKLIGSNWFFVSIVVFASVMPFSQALVSIFSGIVLATAFTEDSWKNKIGRFKKNRILLVFPVIYLFYIFSTLIHGNIENALYDFKKNLFLLIIPLAFMLGKELSAIQKRTLFYTFSTAIVISTIVALFNWRFSAVTSNFTVHKISLISHIRFSFQLILTFWFYVLFVQLNWKILKKSKKLILIVIALYFLFFLLFQQSLTGLIAIISSVLFFLIYTIFQVSFKYRLVLSIFLILFISIPVLYVSQVVKNFYSIEEVNSETIDRKTKQGNLYWHDFNNKSVENGRYVYLYVCEPELREEWNKISEWKYDSIGKNGYPVHSTLMRYLTSKGLRKDAEGVRSLTDKDIGNIENCIANVIYQEKKFSIYPRIYQTVWEYYVYTTTGIADNQSFSQRIEFARAASSIIKRNFWLGVGTGHWKKAFAEVYKKNSSGLSRSHYGSAHNQYLNYMVKFGLPATLLILFLMIFPVIQKKMYTSLFFLIFLVYMFFANFADSNFESHMGLSFFLFFYCIFITGEKNFLQLNNGNFSPDHFHV